MKEALTSFRLCRLTLIRKKPSPVGGAMLECAVALRLVVKGVKRVSSGMGCRGVYCLVGSSHWGLQHQQLLDSCQQELHGFLQGCKDCWDPKWCFQVLCGGKGQAAGVAGACGVHAFSCRGRCGAYVVAGLTADTLTGRA